MAESTSGPWHTYEVTDGYLAVADADGDGLAFVSRSKGGVDECRANARLIAAAPDLLAALRLVIADLSGLQSWEITEIRAAIAKAEGTDG